MRFVLIVILIYFAYQFIFKLVIPVYTASKKFKQGVKEMQDRMQEQMRQQQPTHEASPKPQQQAPKSDYIEFEEL